MKLVHKILLVLFVAIIAGCATTPRTTTPDFSGDPIAQAQSYVNAGRYQDARNVLLQESIQSLSIADQTDYVLLRAEIAQQLDNPAEVLTWLSGEYVYLLDSLPQAELIRISEQRIWAHEQLLQWYQAARERVFIAPLLVDADMQAVHDAIWRNLASLESSDIEQLMMNESSPDLTGWLSLAQLYKRWQASPEQLSASITLWRQRFNNHPAAELLPTELMQITGAGLVMGDTVGIALPLSGALKASGEAVLNGFMAAYYEHLQAGGTAIELVIADTEKSTITDIYQQFASSGVSMMVGPLRQEKLLEVLSLPQDLPIIALNQTSQHRPGLYQFALAPEHDLPIILADAKARGFDNGAIIYPANSYGERMRRAFYSQWQTQEFGIVGDEAFEQTDRRSWLDNVQSLLGVDASNLRARRLAANLGTSLETTARIRQDLDFVLMVASPEEAQLLKPLFNQQFAENMPIYGLSTLATANRQLTDLQGMRLAATPWQLNQYPIESTLARTHGDLGVYQGLYAMGADTFALQLRLSWAQDPSAVRILGATGSLTIDEFGRVQRQLSMAEINERGVQALPTIQQNPFSTRE
ncbi:penicillin-binding protein activator [Salinibius halmophilus]|uniref:penicillin-binding protein activator n=1 Tax=Salinibius halmophilus TaxID=1853216 RepID=UPI000E66575D|nr:penicillin-binding protein activator [Salinibius halmophilus]